MDLKQAIDILEKRESGNYEEAANIVLLKYADLYKSKADDALKDQLRGVISNVLKVEEITADRNDHLLQQLVDTELVHKIHGGITELKQRRLAPKLEETELKPEEAEDKTSDKHCYGLFFPGNPKPVAVVYTAFQKLPEQNTHADYSTLPGDITTIRDKPGSNVINPNAMIFYSVSNPNFSDREWFPELHGIPTGDLVIGKAAELAKSQHPTLTTFSTLSPLRGFSKWLGEQKANIMNPFHEWELMKIAENLQIPHKNGLDFINTVLSDVDTNSSGLIKRMNPRHLKLVWDVIEELAITFLLKVHSDEVEQFHMGRGAVIGGVRVNLKPEMGQDKVMVNYIRGLEGSKERSAAFKVGEVHIANYIPEEALQHQTAISNLLFLSQLNKQGPEIASYSA